MAKSEMLIEFEKKYCEPIRKAYLKKTGKKDEDVANLCSAVHCKHLTKDKWCKPWDDIILKHHMDKHTKNQKPRK